MLFSAYTSSGELPTPNTFGGDFTFDSTLNSKKSISDWKGKVILVNFGFTSCPDICPLVLSKLALVQKIIDEESKTKSLQVVFVTVDPKRDSLEKMTSYLKNFHGSFVGMRSEDQYSKVLRSYGASVHNETINGVNDISHTDYVYVINKQGYVAGFYDIKENYQVLVDAVKKLL